MEKKLDTQTTLEDVKVFIKKFIHERDWDKFHNAKNLSMGMSIEAGELMEHFLWTDTADVQKTFEANQQDIEDELADVIIVAICFANQYNIDINTIITKKMAKNALKYPIEKSKGVATKYTKL